MSTTVQTQRWRELVADKRGRQQESIPKEWLISVPPDDLLDVRKVPEECGLLSEAELQITNTIDVAVILAKLASGEWSAVDVTTAFYKRAIVAQQLVRGSRHTLTFYCSHWISRSIA